MKAIHICMASAAILAMTIAASARELDFLQTDPRFTGGEFNPKNPAKPNFWFYDQYAPARAVMEANGIKLIGINTLTLANLTADSDAFYMPPPTNPAAAYPLSDGEIVILKRYVATGRSIIFNLANHASEKMDNDLFARLKLGAIEGADDVSGNATFPTPEHPIFNGPAGAVESFAVAESGFLEKLGITRSLVTAGGKTVIAYVEKGGLSPKAGAYFFILDGKFLTKWNSRNTSARTFFLNLVNYATQDQYLHFVLEPENETRGK